MTLTTCFSPRRALLLFPVLLFLPYCSAQPGSSALRVTPPQGVSARAGDKVDAVLSLKLTEGYHVNSNTPSDPYLIPLKLTWTPEPVKVTGIEYPKGSVEKYAFSAKPLSVYTGKFELTTHLTVPPGTKKGMHRIPGKVRYQACTESECFPPTTVSFELSLFVR